MNIGRSAGMTDSEIGKSKNKNLFKVFCKRRVDEPPDITVAFESLKWIKTFALHQNVGVEQKISRTKTKFENAYRCLFVYLNVNNYYDQTQDSFEWFVIQFYKGGLINLREE